jgi:hypothetical protein
MLVFWMVALDRNAFVQGGGAGNKDIIGTTSS